MKKNKEIRNKKRATGILFGPAANQAYGLPRENPESVPAPLLHPLTALGRMSSPSPRRTPASARHLPQPSINSSQTLAPSPSQAGYK
jgi:hypothetical protein